MNLVIRAHSLKTENLSQAITGHFDERGGTIGRSDTNTLTLPDPERHISRLQAEVWFSNGNFSIRNVGSANAITVNSRPVNPGEGATLGNGDEIVIGGYAMRATISEFAEPPTEAPVDARTVIRASADESRTNPRMRPMPPTGAPLSAPPSAPVSQPVQPSPLPPISPTTTLAGGNPFADLLGSTASAAPAVKDPFANLLGDPSPPPTTAVHVRVPSPAPAPQAAPTRLPDDFDPFADLPSSSPAPSRAGGGSLDAFLSGSPAPAPSAALPADLGLGDMIGAPASPSSGSLDSLFGLGSAPSAGADPLAAFLSTPAAAAGSPPSPENKDPLAMFGGTPAPAPAPAIPADFNHVPEMKAAYVPPAVKAPVPVPSPVPAPPPRPIPPLDLPTAPAPVARKPVPAEPPRAPVSPAPVPKPAPVAATPAARPQDIIPSGTVPGVRSSRQSFDSAPTPLDAAPPAGNAAPDALWAAFCEGAGVSIKLPQGLTPELMRVIGQVLHHSVDGTIKLVAMRAAAKQELRADVTTIQARNNNPLKFSPDAGTAIEQLLQPPMRGFMMGPAAVNDVMDDLLGHAIGTMAGMRAALTGVLERFEPAQLEGKLAGNSVLDAVLPMNRRAKLWELYLQHYKRIRDDAQDDFHDLFGKAFIEAYEEQLDRLDAARHPI